MSSNDRLRRRVARTGPEEPGLPEPPRHPPDVTALLALQRSAGNRAVVSRLMVDDASAEVKVPQSYADRTLRWDGTYQDKDADERRVSDIIAGSGREHFKAGINYPALRSISTVADATLGVDGAKVWDPKGEKGLGGRFKAAAVDHHRLLHHSGATQIGTAAEATIDPVLDPEDFLPEKPDLPEAGVAVDSPRKEFEKEAAQQAAKQQKVAEKQARKGGKGKGKAKAGDKDGEAENDARKIGTYWEFVCVLIALLSVEGIDCAKATEAASKTPGSMLEAVQALHDHYMRLQQPLQYDDSSARRKVMTEWGYELVFAGRSAWEALPGRVVLKPGKYIFDIKGHTVHVDVLRDVGPRTKIKDVKQFFKCNSDKKNYNKDEFAEQVHYIWAK